MERLCDCDTVPHKGIHHVLPSTVDSRTEVLVDSPEYGYCPCQAEPDETYDAADDELCQCGHRYDAHSQFGDCNVVIIL